MEICSLFFSRSPHQSHHCVMRKFACRQQRESGWCCKEISNKNQSFHFIMMERARSSLFGVVERCKKKHKNMLKARAEGKHNLHSSSYPKRDEIEGVERALILFHPSRHIIILSLWKLKISAHFDALVSVFFFFDFPFFARTLSLAPFRHLATQQTTYSHHFLSHSPLHVKEEREGQ